MKQYEHRIIPSKLQYKSAPSVDQELVVSLQNKNELNVEFDRIRTVSLPQLYDDERQSCTVFRPTFQIDYIYSNAYKGTTQYSPFLNNLFYVDADKTYVSQSWTGYPQFYEFDFFRPDSNDGHFVYEPISAYTYNWTYYLSCAYENDENVKLQSNLYNKSQIWVAKDGIPFFIKNIQINGDSLISFECVCPHGLTPGESVELSFSYGNNNIFEVYSLGNDLFQSSENVFNIYNLGYTGSTFNNNKSGRFKRVINPDIINETKSKYYIRKHKILTNVNDLIITKTGFQKNSFHEDKMIYLSSVTPDLRTRVAKRQSSNSYTITSGKDIELKDLLDNQKRPVSELFLTIIHKGYSGYFNKPTFKSGLKEGWYFNITQQNNNWWSSNNTDSDTTINTLSYTKTSNNLQKTFYYNEDLKEGDVIYGDFCEWNDYEQKERVISSYYHKIKYNQDNFQTTTTNLENANGFYYKPHSSLQLRVYASEVETGELNRIDNIPSYAFFSDSDQQFRWRDLYQYGFIDELNRGVNFPYLNNSHYPFGEIVFRLFPEGNDGNDSLAGINYPIKPLIDGCE